MLFLLGRSQLQHVGGNHHLAAGVLHRRQRGEHGPHGAGVGVVRLVPEGDAAGEPEMLATHGSRLEASQRRRSPIQRHVQCPGRRQGRQGVHQIVAPAHRKLQCGLLLAVGEAGADAIASVITDVSGAQSCAAAHAKGDRLAGVAASQPRHAWVVGVVDQRAAAAQGVDDLPLRGGDLLHRGEVDQVNRLHVEKNGHVRPGDGGQGRHLPGRADSHLQDRHLVAVHELQEHER